MFTSLSSASRIKETLGYLLLPTPKANFANSKARSMAGVPGVSGFASSMIFAALNAVGIREKACLFSSLEIASIRKGAGMKIGAHLIFAAQAGMAIASISSFEVLAAIWSCLGAW